MSEKDTTHPSSGAEEAGPSDVDTKSKNKINKKLSKKALEKLKAEQEKKGIVYISRIPPHLKPQKLRHMLEQYAEIGRVYLAPEDKEARKKRKKSGGNTGKNFTEGWVEFLDKSEAKRIAKALNGQQMGGKKRSSYYYDLWNMKYLPKFKWDHLTEEINYQKAVKEQKLAAEIAAAKRERDFYLSRVDRAKAVESIMQRKRKLPQDGAEDGSDPAAGTGAGASGGKGGSGKRAKRDDEDNVPHDEDRGGALEGVRILRTYGQRQAKPDPDEAPVGVSEKLLKMIAKKG